jgi:hypothetical protein
MVQSERQERIRQVGRQTTIDFIPKDDLKAVLVETLRQLGVLH